MRGLVVALAVGACGGAPTLPAHLEMVGVIPQLSNDTPATFDNTDHLVIMDGSELRRLDGTRLDVVPNTGIFPFGRFGIDRDGTVLIASGATVQIGRLETNDTFTFLPIPPSACD